MKELRLFAEITDESLLFDLIHELGASFFKMRGKSEVEVIYFSGNKFVHFMGKLSEESLTKLKQLAREVDDIEVDEVNGFVKIKEGQ